jgi:hypothetical protein
MPTQLGLLIEFAEILPRASSRVTRELAEW